MSLFSRVRLIAFFFVLFFLTACGGGSSGAGNPANLDIDADPNKIDTGDRMRVRIFVTDMPLGGIALKVRFPTGLSYVDDTAVLSSSSGIRAFDPLDDDTDGTFNYLVFFLRPENFGPSGQGTVEVVLRGVAEVTAEDIEVEADLDDPDIDNRDEFSPDEPNFTVQEKETVDVLA